jgi:hypothetical protein
VTADDSDDQDDYAGDEISATNRPVGREWQSCKSQLPTRVDKEPQRRAVYRIEARVTDAANREIDGHNSPSIATYGSFQVGVSPDSYVYKAGDNDSRDRRGEGLRWEADSDLGPCGTR